ncbi:hypothetical protein BX070DRAFT_60795 [Coemansia spiralis]|nr:hypothetical protein BX070DRAFT_60795 [Coemansia spiralis]
MECTCHRIFLATLIVAGKYLNDASPKNKYWARYSTVFTVAEVNLMEKQLLFLLDFDLRIDNEDLNEAASSFYANNSKHSVPLTPTTPPFGASHSQAIGNTESAATAAASSSTPSRCKADSGNMPDSMHAIPSEIYPQYQQPQKSNYYHGNPETAKIYPSTLGLGNKSEQSLRSRQHTASCNNSSSMAAINDRENVRTIDNHAYPYTHARTHSASSIGPLNKSLRRCSH